MGVGDSAFCVGILPQILHNTHQWDVDKPQDLEKGDLRKLDAMVAVWDGWR